MSQHYVQTIKVLIRNIYLFLYCLIFVIDFQTLCFGNIIFIGKSIQQIYLLDQFG